MHEKVHCDECLGMAVPKDNVVRRPDDSKWIHYDCEKGHTFDQDLTGQRSECLCLTQDTPP